MNDEIMKKVQEQARMTSKEHEELFEKVDTQKPFRENLEKGLEKLKGNLRGKQAQEADRKIRGLLENMQPSYKIEVNEEAARKRDEIVSKRLESEIRKGNIPRFDPKRDPKAYRWMKKARGL